MTHTDAQLIPRFQRIVAHFVFFAPLCPAAIHRRRLIVLLDSFWEIQFCLIFDFSRIRNGLDQSEQGSPEFPSAFATIHEAMVRAAARAGRRTAAPAEAANANTKSAYDRRSELAQYPVLSKSKKLLFDATKLAFSNTGSAQTEEARASAERQFLRLNTEEKTRIFKELMKAGRSLIQLDTCNAGQDNVRFGPDRIGGVSIEFRLPQCGAKCTGLPLFRETLEAALKHCASLDTDLESDSNSDIVSSSKVNQEEVAEPVPESETIPSSCSSPEINQASPNNEPPTEPYPLREQNKKLHSQLLRQQQLTKALSQQITAHMSRISEITRQVEKLNDNLDSKELSTDWQTKRTVRLNRPLRQKNAMEPPVSALSLPSPPVLSVSAGPPSASPLRAAERKATQHSPTWVDVARSPSLSKLPESMQAKLECLRSFLREKGFSTQKTVTFTGPRTEAGTKALFQIESQPIVVSVYFGGVPRGPIAELK